MPFGGDREASPTSVGEAYWQRKLLSVARILDRAIAVACEAVLILGGIALTATLTANIVARYVLATGGFDWAEEVPEQIFPWFIVAGVTLAVQRGGHIAVEWLPGKLNRNATRVLLLAGHALVVCTYFYLSYKSLEVASIVAIERSPALGLPKSYGYWAIAVGCVLVAISTAAAAARIALIGPESLPRPAPESAPT